MVAGIVRELTERGVPCPSEVDPQRNRHRDGGPWTLSTVAAILSNPRYTDRQAATGRATVRRSEPPVDVGGAH
jgi:site-specific DNA recombinase